MLKVKQKVIEQIVYVTTDGAEFDSLNKAELWEIHLIYHAQIKPLMYVYGDEDYYIIRSKEQFRILEQYLTDHSKHCLCYHFDVDKISYPVILKYDEDCYMTIFSKEDYEHFHKLCGIYESLH